MAIISAIPNVLTAGNDVTASVLNTNFNHIVSQVNANGPNATYAVAATGGYFTAVATDPKLEIHKPGVLAGMWHINAANKFALEGTNGAGVTSGSVYLTIDTSGNLVALGDVTGTSDERLKTNWQSLPANFVDQLATVKSGIFDRIDIDQTQVGVSAQSLQNILPNAVQADDAGMLSVAYGNAALVSCVELAKRIVALEAVIAGLLK